METHDQESAAAEGARRATGGAAGRDRKGRFSARRKRATVLRLLRGEDLESVSRELGITAARASLWRESVSRRGPGGPEEPRDGCPGRRQPSAPGQGRRAPDGERAAVCEGGPPGGRRPFGPAEVDAMSGAQSISTRRAYGVQRICRVWERARSSVYARRHATTSRARRGVAAGRSGPPRTRCWLATSAGCLKPRRFMARGTAKPGRSCGSRGSAPRRSGCGG